MGENLHAGHRERMKKEFLTNGFTPDMPEHKKLELLLFYCIPRIDTNDIAHELLNRYGDIPGVLDAPVDELVTFKGITENNVGLLKMIIPIARHYIDKKNSAKLIFNNINEVGDYLLNKFFGLTEENFVAVSLDGKGKLLSFDILSKGDISSVGVSTRDLIQLAFKTNATCIVIAHNHPGGVALPSNEDIAITEAVNIALKQIGVRLLDHIIVANSDYISMNQTPKYQYIFK